MALSTLLGQVSEEALKALPGRIRSPERVQQHLDAFGLHLQGVSYRGIQERFGWKSVSTAENSVKRGEELAKNLNLDGERIRLKLANFFDELCDISLKQIKDQVEAGRVIVDIDADGNKSMRCMKGVDPRMLGEAGRGAIRFAEFAGLMDRAPEVNTAAVTMVNLSAPGDGASFAYKWGQPAVDVTAQSTENGSNGHESGHTGSTSVINRSQGVDGPTAYKAVEEQK